MGFFLFIFFFLQILREAGFACSYSYSSLDQTARKIQVSKIKEKEKQKCNSGKSIKVNKMLNTAGLFFVEQL